MHGLHYAGIMPRHVGMKIGRPFSTLLSTGTNGLFSPCRTLGLALEVAPPSSAAHPSP